MLGLPVHELFLARCQDAHVPPTPDRERRFEQSLARTCIPTTHLDLREQGLKRHSAEMLAGWLSRLPFDDESGEGEGNVVTSVVLSNNELGDDGAAALCMALLRNTTVTHLDVRSNAIAATGSRALLEALESNSTLTSIDIGSLLGVRRNVLGAKGGKALGSCMARNHVLACIGAHDASLGLRGAEGLAPGLRLTDSLVRLDISRNQLGPEGCLAVCSALCAATAAPLEYLNLSSNVVGNPGAEAIAELLAIHATLEEVDISCNAIGPTGMASIGRALQLRCQPHSPLVSLNAADNSSGNAGIVELCKWAMRSPVLTVLVLSGNAISVGEELAAVIRSSVSLERLDLRRNALGASGAVAICAALVANGSSLNSLDLGGNRIDGSSGTSIAQAIAQNSTLQHFSLRDNRLDAAAGSAIATAVIHNATLLTLNVDVGNNIVYADFATIQQQLKKNRHDWERAAPIRDAEQLARLRENAQQLHEIEQELATTTSQRESTTLLSQTSQQALAESKSARDSAIAAASSELSARTAAVRDIADRAGPAATAAVREASESRRQQLIAQIREHRSVARKLTLMVEKLGTELQSRLSEFESEREELTKQLSLASLDLQNSAEDLTVLRQKAADMRAVLSRLEEQALVAATSKKKGSVAVGAKKKVPVAMPTTKSIPVIPTTDVQMQQARDRLASARARVAEDAEMPRTRYCGSPMLPLVRTSTNERGFSAVMTSRPLTSTSITDGATAAPDRLSSRGSVLTTMMTPPESQVRQPVRPAKLAPLKPPPLPSDVPGCETTAPPADVCPDTMKPGSSHVSGRLRSASFAHSSRLPKSPPL